MTEMNHEHTSLDRVSRTTHREMSSGGKRVGNEWMVFARTKSVSRSTTAKLLVRASCTCTLTYITCEPFTDMNWLYRARTHAVHHTFSLHIPHYASRLVWINNKTSEIIVSLFDIMEFSSLSLATQSSSCVFIYEHFRYRIAHELEKNEAQTG